MGKVEGWSDVHGGDVQEIRCWCRTAKSAGGSARIWPPRLFVAAWSHSTSQLISLEFGRLGSSLCRR